MARESLSHRGLNSLPRTVQHLTKKRPKNIGTLSGGSWAAQRVYKSLGIDTGAQQLAERLDVWSAKLFVEALDPNLQPDQSDKIQRMLRTRKAIVSHPQTTSYEEQDPRYGGIVLATLTQGEYGLHKIVNRTDPRINKPPSSIPPLRFDVHLCWGVAYPTAAHYIKRSDGEIITCASILQGVVALIADDWRQALRPLPIDFYIHRCNPQSNRKSVKIKLGRRSRNKEKQRLPTDEFISLMFERVSLATAVRQTRWVNPTGARPLASQSSQDWWCGLIEKNDLEALGFTAKKEIKSSGHRWISDKPNVLIKNITHIIVVDSVQYLGDIFSIAHQANRTILSPLPLRQNFNDDASFTQLRISAIDLLVEELWIRMSKNG